MFVLPGLIVFDIIITSRSISSKLAKLRLITENNGAIRWLWPLKSRLFLWTSVRNSLGPSRTLHGRVDEFSSDYRLRSALETNLQAYGRATRVDLEILGRILTFIISVNFLMPHNFFSVYVNFS